MIPLVTGLLTYTQSTAAIVGSMVVLVVVSALLETHMPAPRARSTRLSFPRRVKGSVDGVPQLDPHMVRAEYNRRLTAELTPRPMVLVYPGSDHEESARPAPAPEPELVVPAAVEVLDPDVGPPTERLPEVVVAPWANHEDFAPAARTAIRSAVAHRMAAPEPWSASGLRQGLTEPIIADRETTMEEAFAVGMERLDAKTAGEAPPVPVPPVMVARADDCGVPMVQLGAIGSVRDLAGVLFAAYVASGLEERNRVTGWVAPLAAPPSLPDLDPTERLRGRPGRVAALLRCADGGRNWVTLDESTDVGRGLTARPPTDDDLKGIVWWWVLATEQRAKIPTEHVRILRRGLEAVAPVLEGHPSAATVASLIRMADSAERLGVDVRIDSVRADEFAVAS